MSELLTGIVEGIIYRNAENGYSVLEIGGSDGLNFVAVGIMPLPETGEKIELSGIWTEHKTYGNQFKVIAYKIIPPTASEDIINYLANSNIKGIGKSTAIQIVEKFGENTFDIMDNNPERLLEITGIGKKRLQEIISNYNANRANRTVMIEMQKLDITPTQAAKIFRAYGSGCIEIIRKNPYRLIDEIEGIGFKIADKIAQKLGIEYNAPIRIRAAIIYMLEWAKQEGHTYLPYNVLIDAVCSTLSLNKDETEDELKEMLKHERLVENTIDGVKIVFLPYMRKAEMDIAVRLIEQNRRIKGTVRFDIQEEIERAAAGIGIELAQNQADAIKAMFEKGVVVITGGPGTGKTTILKIAIEIMSKWSMSFELCAPTGRAAKRMSAATGSRAQTIHRLLEYSFTEQQFMRDESDPLDTDFVIVDEMSMVDVQLMDALVKAITDSTRIILVGDADQLPSVGAGNVLRDILTSGAIYSVRLTEIYRQAATSMIISNAHKINNGVEPDLDDLSSDFNFYEIYDQNAILNEVIAIFKGETQGILRTTDIMNDVQILAPMKKGVLGVNNLNLCIQNAINPHDEYKPELQYGDTVFRLGDRVMQIKNNYTIEWTRSENGILIDEGKGIFNGDIGTVTGVDKRNSTLEITYESGTVAEYTHDILQELTLAYCISIHKSQGSEFHTVLMPIAGGPPGFFTRNLLYTAVTRAKSQVCILGRREILYAMVANKSTKNRYTALSYMMEEYASCIR